MTINGLLQEKNNYLNRIKDIDLKIKAIEDENAAAKMTAEDLKKLSYYKKELEKTNPVPTDYEKTII